MSTILVIDDLSIYREPIAAVLRQAGYHVVAAASGAEALVLISKRRPDLVLLDLSMPEMDGMSVLQTMRREPPTADIPVIVLSVETDRARITQAVGLGISGYILKSQFSLKALLDRVAKALARAESSAQVSADPPASAPGDAQIPPGRCA